jgi:hypothetical protein
MSVFVGSVVLVLSVETLLEARLTSEEVVARRAVRRWAAVGVALVSLIALFLESEKGEGMLWVVVPILYGPTLYAWFYLARRFAHAIAFRLVPVAAFSLGSGALLVSSVHFDTPPFVLVFAAFLLASPIWAVVAGVRAFTAPRKLGGWPPKENDGSR